ncbi:MAG: hypothetical protein AAF215_18770 [Cyanobacteria bacterium P01_A01_bin.123]
MQTIAPIDFNTLCDGSLRQVGKIRYSFLEAGWLAFEGLAGWTNTRGCPDGASTLEFEHLHLHKELLTRLKQVPEASSTHSFIEAQSSLCERLLGLNGIHPECVDTRLTRWLLLPHTEGGQVHMAPLELINRPEWITAMMLRNGVKPNG